MIQHLFHCWSGLNSFYYKLSISYDGSDFCGFQIQPNKKTIESELKEALVKFFGGLVKLRYSGRTDTGVHASQQIVVAQVNIDRDPMTVMKGVNRYLPQDIVVLSVSLCDSTFDPRFDAQSRVYSYVFTPDKVPIYLRKYLVAVQFEPMLSCFHKFSDIITGTHDFQHVRKKGSNETSTVRTIMSCEMVKDKIKDLYDFDKLITVYQIKIKANAFLYRMVRNIVGLYFDLEQNRLTYEDILQLLLENQHNIKVKPAPAYGLSLLNVVY